MFKKLLFFSLIISILFSCSTSNDVVSNGFLQKRKYRKGWYVNSSPQKYKTKKGKLEDVLVVNSNTKQKKEDIFFEDNNTVIDKDYLEKEVKSIDNKILIDERGFVIESNKLLEEVRKSNAIKQVFQDEYIISKSKNKTILSIGKEEEPEKKNHDVLWVVLGIMIVIFGYSPIGILVGLGVTEDFWINLLLYVAGFTMLIIGLISGLGVGAVVVATTYESMLLMISGGALLLISYIHAFYVLIKALL